jgi:hypothetical protein
MSLALLSGNLMTVLAADTSIIQPVTIGKAPKEGTVGQEVDLGALQNCDVRVKDPLGNDIELTDDSKFTPSKAGYYTINVYAANGVFYEGFKINITVDDAVILIPYNGAEIPTYINTGSDIKIPKASMVVYDEDGKIDEEKTDELNYDIKYIVTDPEGNDTVLTATEDDYLTYSGDKTNTSGSYIVRYKASTDNNAVVKTTDFIVNAQEGFEDTQKPELKIPGVPNSAPQRVKLTLPKATATDKIDENVKVTITVKDSDGENVLEVDDTDPKNLVLGTDEVIFDNNNNRSFYPWKPGPYNVKYTATDDSGNTVESTYVINISDTRAPVIELDENKIPEVWAINVENASGKLIGDSSLLVVPKPQVWDNVTPQEDIEVYFSVKNSSGQFVYDSKEENQSSLYKEGFIDEYDDNYYLDFDVLTSKTGTFTLTFTARDRDANGKLKNSSYKPISIDIKEELKDTDYPKLQVVNIPQYVMVDEKFEKPALIPYDETSKVIIEETYEFIDEDDETIEFDFEDKDYFIPETAGQIKITYKVQDSVGNKVLDKDENEVDSLTYTIDVYSDVIDTNAPTFKADSKWIDADNSETSLFGDDEGDLVQRTIYYNDAGSKKVTVADIVIESASDEYDFIGYEVIVREPDTKTIGESTYQGVGQKLNTTVKSKVQFNDGTNKWELVLEKISFEVKKEGKHSLTIRAFNISGASTLATVTFDVEKFTPSGPTSSSGSGGISSLSSAATIPNEMELNKPFTLPLKDIEGNEFVAREITGPAYEIMGNVFTPKAIGQFTITLTAENGDVMKEHVTCVDTVSPVFKLLGEIPSYSKKYDKDDNSDAFITIPEVSIIDKGTLKEYSVKVVDNNGETVNITENEEGKEGFVPRVDGTYTITYTINDAGNTATYSLKIRVGDLIMPRIIDVSKIAPSATKFKQNDKLYVKELAKDNVSDNVTKAEDLTITRTLYGPNGNAISIERDDKNQEFYTLKDAGNYTLAYTVKDEAGNVYTKEFTITVTGEGKTPFNYQILSTVLIITAVVLIIGVGVYFFRFRKIKETK